MAWITQTWDGLCSSAYALERLVLIVSYSVGEIDNTDLGRFPFAAFPSLSGSTLSGRFWNWSMGSVSTAARIASLAEITKEPGFTEAVYSLPLDVDKVQDQRCRILV